MQKSSLQTESEKTLINTQLEELLASCNCPEDGQKRIRKAFVFANHAHMGVRRKAGEPYILHPLAVAMIVVKEIGLGEDAVCAALLHDVVEDADYTVEDIRSRFGDKVAELVDGLTKIEGVFDKTQSKQAENFKKILLTLVTDVNVILIKLADRLHNMRTLDAMSEKKQFQIASETFYLFAPLADRLGFYKIKTELEDLSLKYYEPAAYKEIKEKIDKKEKESEAFIQKFEAPVIEKLKEAEIEFVINSRFKSVYSTWRKMQNKNIPFEEVYDLFAIRIVFKPKNTLPERTQCWAIYSLITEIYRSNNLERLRDWVGTPKANGYEALHCTLMGQGGVWVEVQIKTERMDDISEKGIAAHWKYKASGKSKSELDEWLQHVRETLMKNNDDAEIFVDTFKRHHLVPEIYVFTPKGEERKLPKGATALDFAYDIHSHIGNHAIAAKVNYKLVSLNHVLKSTDQVEIITTRTQKPKKEWIDFVTTVKAKNLIKTALKSEIKEHSKKGRDIIDKKLAELGIQPSARTYRKLIEAYKQTNKEELFSNVGAGLLNLDNFNKVIRENTPQKWVQYWGMQLGFGGKPKIKNLRKKVEERQQNTGKTKIDNKSTYLLKDDLSYKIAECCKPIPGDEIIGFADNTTSIVTVHKKRCDTATEMAAQHFERIVNAQWSVHKILSFLAILEIRGIDRLGILRDLTDIIADQLNVNIRKLNIESHDGIFEGFIELYVHDLEDLNVLITTVQQIKGMDSVKRVEKVNEAGEQ
jgi:GTP pyrophosphokinase